MPGWPSRSPTKTIRVLSGDHTGEGFLMPSVESGIALARVRSTSHRLDEVDESDRTSTALVLSGAIATSEYRPGGALTVPVVLPVWSIHCTSVFATVPGSTRAILSAEADTRRPAS